MFVSNSKIISNIKNEKHFDCLEHTSIFHSLHFQQHKTTELYGRSGKCYQKSSNPTSPLTGDEWWPNSGKDVHR